MLRTCFGGDDFEEEEDLFGGKVCAGQNVVALLLRRVVGAWRLKGMWKEEGGAEMQ
jgi:hypothetical protein